jgi:hypothetical protein
MVVKKSSWSMEYLKMSMGAIRLDLGSEALI